MKTAQELLTENGITVTKNRVNVLNCLSDGTHFHSIPDIISHSPDLNTKSIYNTMFLLERKGIVDSITIDGTSKYALNDQIAFNENYIHVVNNGEIAHLETDVKIFNTIKAHVKKSGSEVKSIKIFVTT